MHCETVEAAAAGPVQEFRPAREREELSMDKSVPLFPSEWGTDSSSASLPIASQCLPLMEGDDVVATKESQQSGPMSEAAMPLTASEIPLMVL